VLAVFGRLGRRVRTLRLGLQLTQERAATLAHLDPKHLQTIEAGKTNTTVASLVGLARALGVPLSELFEDV
jgi:transcriptional regulator with XRE-family HTH domain